MRKPRFLISLCTDDNDYQREQASDAEHAARRLGVDIDVVYAKSDAIHQAQHLLEVIQYSKGPHPDAIILEPVGGTALPVVAKAAGAAGIGWVLLNREADYIADLRKSCSVPAFAVTSNHEETGRLQAKQFTALLPNGGSLLYVQGPSESLAAKQRTLGLLDSKPDNIQVRTLKGQWTVESAQRSVRSWLQLSTSRNAQIDAVGCQDDAMAFGARKAFDELPDLKERDRWLHIPFTGCDGQRDTGRKWVDQGLLAATIIIPPNAGLALDMLMKIVNTGAQPPEVTYTTITSYPPLEILSRRAASRSGKEGGI